jgi:hypothetical protein
MLEIVGSGTMVADHSRAHIRTAAACQHGGHRFRVTGYDRPAEVLAAMRRPELDCRYSVLDALRCNAAARPRGGIPFHVAHAKRAGATGDEVISAILIGLPAAGNGVTYALPAVIRAYDES